MVALQLFVFPPRPADQFAAAIRTNAFHLFRTILTKRAFVRTDVSFAAWRQFASTSFALCPHFQGHVVSRRATLIVSNDYRRNRDAQNEFNHYAQVARRNLRDRGKP